MKSARCPYCGKKVSYFKIFSEKTKGEHTCKECGRNSTIYFIRAYKFTVMITVVLAIILALVILFSTFVDDIWGVLLVFIPFAVLYLITPLFCKLVPIKKRKKRPKSEEAPTIYNPKNNNGSITIKIHKNHIPCLPLQAKKHTRLLQKKQ